MKFILVLAIGLVAVVTIACANVNNPTDEPSSTQQWQKNHPQVFSNVGSYQKLFESNTSIIKNKTESNQVLITNQFGIYDAVLTYLIETISNESMLYASIKFEQLNEKMYFSDSTESAVYYAREGNLPLNCMALINSREERKILKETRKILMANQTYKTAIEKNQSRLNLHIIGSNLPYDKMDKICQTGNY